MKNKSYAIVMGFICIVYFGCASIDSQIAQDLRFAVMNSDEIGYGTGHGLGVELLGKISDKEKIYEIANKLKFGEGSEISSQEPLDRYMFFMNRNKTMTIIRFEREKIQYQGKEYKMNNETREYLNKLYR